MLVPAWKSEAEGAEKPVQLLKPPIGEPPSEPRMAVSFSLIHSMPLSAANWPAKLASAAWAAVRLKVSEYW